MPKTEVGIVVLLVALVAFGAANAAPCQDRVVAGDVEGEVGSRVMADLPPWPADDQWRPVVFHDWDVLYHLVDPSGDGGMPVFDLVGDMERPVFYSTDSADFYHLRIRLADTPLADPLGYRPVVVRLLLEFVPPIDLESYDYDIVFSGIIGEVMVRQNSVEISDWCGDSPEDIILSFAAPPDGSQHARVVPAGSNLGGTANQFLDMRLPRADLDASVGWHPLGARLIVLGTSTSVGLIDRDTANLECGYGWTSMHGDVPDAPGGDLNLHQNAPNPFNPRTVIRFELHGEQKVSLRVHDAAGRIVRTLMDAMTLPAGLHTSVWDGRDDTGRNVAAGTYLYRLDAGEASATKRMTLIK